MPVVDESAARCHTGLYRFLHEAEEVEFRRWEEGQRRRIANGYNAGSYPRQRRLDAFGSALPVNVPREKFGDGTRLTRALRLSRGPLVGYRRG